MHALEVRLQRYMTAALFCAAIINTTTAAAAVTSYRVTVNAAPKTALRANPQRTVNTTVFLWGWKVERGTTYHKPGNSVPVTHAHAHAQQQQHAFWPREEKKFPPAT